MTESKRTFTTINAWNEFLERWEKVEGQPEAIGLLYAGARVGVGGRPQRMLFYLEQAEIEDPVIAQNAQQLLVKSYFRDFRIMVSLTPEEMVAIEMTLHFLSNLHPSLLSPPYPKLISIFLGTIHDAWRHGDHPDYRNGQIYKELQKVTEPLVKALCAWGLGHLLAGDGSHPETIPLVKQFLVENKVDVGEVFMRLDEGLTPCADISSLGAQEEIKLRAAAALLKMQYWFGEGVTAKF